MDLESVDIASYSTAKAIKDTKDSSGVKLITNQRDQQKAVVGKILSGIEEAPRPSGQTGQHLNVKA